MEKRLRDRVQGNVKLNLTFVYEDSENKARF